MCALQPFDPVAKGDYLYINFIATPIEEEILARASHDERNMVARRDLERYYRLLERLLPAISTEEEALLCDVFGGQTFEAAVSVKLWADLYETDEEVFARHGVEREPFISRMRALSDAERLAVVDFIERTCG